MIVLNFYKISLKFILSIFFVIIFFSTANAKEVDKFENGKKIRDYFFGLLLLNENKHDKSYKYLKTLNGLENSHRNFSNYFIYSLINSGKFNEAFNYSKKLENKNLSIFESDLIIGIYYLKNKEFDLAQKYFQKISANKNNTVLNAFVVNSLLNWASLDNLKMNEALLKIESSSSKSLSLNRIQKVFLHCFYDSEKTKFLFEDLILDKKIDFSRYHYFYAVFLNKKINQRKKKR